MEGAINIIQKWSSICYSHTFQKVEGGRVLKFPQCQCCELYSICKKNPVDRTKEDIQKLVSLISKKDIKDE